MGPVAHPVMNAAVLTADRTMEYREVPVPEAGPGELLVRVAASGICGSDLSAYRGLHPYKKAPVVLGHEFCGRVVATGPGVDRFSAGDLVCSSAYASCDTCPPCRTGATHLCRNRTNLSHLGWEGSFAELVLLRENMTYRLPAGLDHEAGAMVEPLSIGLHAMRLADATGGPAVTVLGTGTIGLACVVAARRLGFGPVHCVDRGPGKGDLARSVGADGYVDVDQEELRPGSAALTPGGSDITVIASGHPGVVTDAAAITRPGGQVIVVSYFGGPQDVDWNSLVSAELTVRFSALSTAADFEEVIGWLDRGEVDPVSLVTHRFPLHDAAAAMHLMDEAAGTVGKILLQVDRESE
ncbi:zinc-binding dehydrogenase [Streptomyces sp. NPDC096198]|uniref:zinc-dependent alcohol dehydrogenase n=1 Tax=Streptomyces sp. NPDC096198 TaxID=3366080 RepID=UPI003812988B